MWVLTFYATNTFVRNISHAKKNSVRYVLSQMYINLQVKDSLLFSNVNFLNARSKKNPQISTLMTIDPEGAGLFHVDREADRRTDIHDEASSRFSEFCESA
jgi:hypothetical protein